MTDDGLAIGVFADGTTTLTEDPRLAEWVEQAAEMLRFDSSVGSVAIVPGPHYHDGIIYLVGLGHDPGIPQIRRAGQALGRAAVGDVRTALDRLSIDGVAEALIQAFRLGSYRFDRYKSSPGGQAPALKLSRSTSVEGPDDAAWEAARWMLDLIHTPAADKSPSQIAVDVVDIAGSQRTRIWDQRSLMEGGFGGILGIAQGSPHEPVLLDLHFRPRGARTSITLVGKGVIFDSGGLAMKSPKAMSTMKNDMAGAACVIAVAIAAATMELPIEVRVLAPLVENAVDGNALHPGDVVRLCDGTTVEVSDTDAEGRLILADAIALAVEEQPDLIVDVATLTLAVEQGLGPHYAALFSNSEELTKALLQAEDSWEMLWPVPLDHRLARSLESSLADLRNISGLDVGGAIVGALFLERFVDDIRWAHVDLGNVTETIPGCFFTLLGLLERLSTGKGTFGGVRDPNQPRTVVERS